MTQHPIPALVCPETGVRLVVRGEALWTADGSRHYPIVNGIPCCVYPSRPEGNDARWLRFYDWFSPFYEKSERILGRLITGVDIVAARKKVVEFLPISHGERLLEVSPGPGIYQSLLAQRVGEDGHITALDLSQGMLVQCRNNTRHQKPAPRLIRGNAAYLPFETGSFDGLFHFGGVNLFSEPARALTEFARVVRPGGWVAFGDEQFSPRWRERRGWRASVLRRMNPGYGRPAPDTPSSLECHHDHEVFGGLGYLRVCRVNLPHIVAPNYG